jgi:5-methylcytosine-specific restriction endonuclease McrA
MKTCTKCKQEKQYDIPCGYDATQLDHYRPINKDAGGTNTADNVRPACKDCNHKRSHRWHGEELATREAEMLKQLKELLK